MTEGDRVRIVVTNRLDEPHTTHWHGLYGMFVIEERDPPAIRRSDREEQRVLGDGTLGFVLFPDPCSC